MTTPAMRRLALVLLIVLVAASARDDRATACQPSFIHAVFTVARHPDFPLDPFAAGRLGIVQPTWARSQLVVAYRFLSGVPLTPREQAGALALWTERLTIASPPETGAVAVWLAARAKVPSAQPLDGIGPNRLLPKIYSSYLNCTDDAFITAASTLDKRIVALGAGSDGVQSWLTAQDQVFDNCSGPRIIPDPAAATLPAAIRADRSYQIAAALFYAGDYDAAGRAFDVIAADTESPWREVAPYLAIRALVRRGTVLEERHGLDTAEARLTAMVADPAFADRREASQRLLNFVRARTRPAAQASELGRRLTKPATAAGFKQDLWDYTMLLDWFEGENAGPANPDRWGTRQPQEMRPDDELTDWILTVQQKGARAGYTIDQWTATRSQAWLVAALMAATPGPSSAPLVEAAVAVPADSPAFPTACYHAIRLLAGTGRTGDARARLDAVLPAVKADWPVSARNAMLAARTALARDINEFIAFGVRTPALVTADRDGRQMPHDDSDDAWGKPVEVERMTSTFGDDVARVLYRSVPTVKLLDLATAASLPAHLRNHVVSVVWIRAAVLGQSEPTNRTAAILARTDPQLKSCAAAYLAANTSADKRFAAVFCALRNPGLDPWVGGGLGRMTPMNRIDDYHGNWWCGGEVKAESDGSVGADGATFPSAADRRATVAENAALTALGTAPNYFAKQVLEYAATHTTDDRVPEALALVVKATRFGCVDDETTKWSRAAFVRLHQQYPSTTWAKKTKFWY